MRNYSVQGSWLSSMHALVATGKIPAQLAMVALSLSLSGCFLGGNNNDEQPPVACNTMGPGTLSFSAPTYNVAEGAGAATITVNRAGGCQGAVSAQASTVTAGSTATAGADYTAITNQVLSWIDGDSAAKTFTVTIANDTAAEGSETVNLGLGGATGGATLAAPTSAVLTIADDPAGTVQLGAATFTAGEAAGTAAITLSRTGGAEGAASVQISTSNGTATAGADYTAVTNQVVNWAAGDAAAKTVNITIANDGATEGSESVNLALTGVTGAALGTQTAAVLTITDAPGSLQFASANPTVNEGGGTATITVTRAGGNGGAVSVNFATSNGSATAGSDYTAANGTLNWAAGDTTPKTFTVAITDDAAVDPGETVNLTLSAPGGGAVLGATPTSTLTIIDNDVPGTIQFSAASFNAGESSGTATITASRSGGSGGSVGVTFATSNGSAIAGSDYTAKTGTLSWGPGDTVDKTFTVAILNDTANEGSETVSLTLSAPTGGAVLGAQTGAVLNIADDPAGTLQFSSGTFSGNENAGTATISVTRIGGSEGAASVQVSTSNGSATAGADYTAIAGQTLNWVAGDMTTKTFNVTIANDNSIEGNETVNLTLSGATGAALGTQTGAVLTIADAAGALQFGQPTYSVSESGTNVTIDVTRINGSGGAVAVNFATSNGSATAGSDYTAQSGTLNWAAGDNSSKTFVVAITNDTAFEGNETINLTLSAPTNSAVLGAQNPAVLTINDDAPGNLQFSAAAFGANESSGTATITVTRAGGSEGGATVKVSTSNGTATAPGDYTTITNQTVSWAAGDATPKTFTVTIANDTAVEGSETVNLALSANTTAGLGAPNTAVLTILDDPTGTLQFSSAGYSGAENGGGINITVTRVGGNEGVASVTFATSDGTATLAGNDYVTNTGTLNWAAGDTSTKSFTVSPIDDSAVEGNETVGLTLSGATGATLGAPSTATATITDDSTGTVQFSAATFSVAENAGTATITVTRASGSEGAASVKVSTSNGSATAGSDYTAITNQVINWAAGDTAAKTFTVTITNDSAIESAETVNLTLTAPTGATLGAQTGAVLTINDDDVPGSLQFSSAAFNATEGTPATITVTRTGGVGGAVSAHFQSSPGTAGVPNDYTAVSGTLNWAAGDGAAKTFDVPITQDATAESAETFSVALSAPTGGATVGAPGTATVTINDAPVATRDYFLTYGVRDNTTINGFTGAVGVNAADFSASQQIPVVTGNFDGASVYTTGDFDGTTFTNQRPFSFIYHQGGKWFRVGLRTSDSHVAVQMSSENTTDGICSTRTEFSDLSTPLTAVFLYQLDGADNSCNTADDVFKIIHLNDGSGVAPVTLTGFQDFVTAFHSNVNGQLQRVIAVQNGNLVALDASFGFLQTLQSGVSNADRQSDFSLNDALVKVDNTVRRVSFNGTTVTESASLFTLGGTESFGNSNGRLEDNTNIYILAQTGNPVATSVRLVRIKKDGTAAGQTMFTFAGFMNGLAVTDNNVIVETNASNTQTLVAVAKTATSTTVGTTLDTISGGCYCFGAIGIGSKVYYTALHFSPTPRTTTVKISNDTGGAPISTFNASQIVGQSQSFTFNITANIVNQGVPFFLLAQGATDFDVSGLSGAALKSFKTADDTTTTLLASISDVNVPFINDAFAQGFAGIGDFVLEPSGGGTQHTDVFAFDVEENRFLRLTSTGTTDELPISDF